jgi:glucans biosynthesis protein
VETRKATVAQTRIGESRTGEIAFLVDFLGAESCEGCNAAPITANVTASAGEVRNARLAPTPGGSMQRLRFEYAPAGSEPVDLRAQLLVNGKPASETWIFRWTR